MARNFIDQVRSIVMEHLSDEQFGVRELASKLGLSSSQTLRKIKQATGKPANRYIRELRLEKAAKLIKTTDMTAAEISYKVGFGSPSYFNKAFAKYYGVAPGEYKTKSKNLEQLAKAKAQAHERSGLGTYRKKVFYGVAITAIVAVGYLLSGMFSSKEPELANSIAVLPFKDFSPEDNQWFSDGISDNILHSLAQIGDLAVISYTSSATYRDTEKKIPEIARELNVSYILEGSVTLYQGKIKVITQLIDVNDVHLWSKEYVGDFDDVIGVQNSIAREVVDQLKITLSRREEPLLERYPTSNPVAYDLHLKGKNVFDSRNSDDLLRNIEYNEKAIALDSTFSDAYADLAHSYYYVAKQGRGRVDPVIGMEKANTFANLALQYNTEASKAWAVKGLINHFKNWDKAEEYHQRAVTANPNDANAHAHFAQYYLYRPEPDIEKFLKETTIAQRLNPFSRSISDDHFWALIVNGKLDQAEAYLNERSNLFSDDYNFYKKLEYIAYKQKDWMVAIEVVREALQKDPDNVFLNCRLARSYDCILNDPESAIPYFRKAYTLDSSYSFNTFWYYRTLLVAGKFKEAKRILESHYSKSNEWQYYYSSGDYEKALELSRDKALINDYIVQNLTYAAIGNKQAVDSIGKRLYWGVYSPDVWRTWKAIIHAKLGQRDSMYHYLEKVKYDRVMRIAGNRRPEFDPYRHEARYKAILRENHIPVPGE